MSDKGITEKQSLYLRKISHDYNNTMAGISGYIELLTAKVQLDDDLQKYLERIHALIEKTSTLTQQLSKFAHTGAMEDLDADQR